jgi:hypothetical protein
MKHLQMKITLDNLLLKMTLGNLPWLLASKKLGSNLSKHALLKTSLAHLSLQKISDHPLLTKIPGHLLCKTTLEYLSLQKMPYQLLLKKILGHLLLETTLEHLLWRQISKKPVRYP